MVLALVCTLLLATAYAQQNSTVNEVAALPAKFLASQESLEPTSESTQSLESTSAAMEAAMTDLLLGNTKFGATPMGGSVKKIEELITKDMMPKVLAAHNLDQKNLNRLAAEIAKCGSVKNAGLNKAAPSRNEYNKNSGFHTKCRGNEAVLYTSKEDCLKKQRALFQVKQLKCNHFATVSKQLTNQVSNRNIVKKAAAESTESYLVRMAGTICGEHGHGPKGKKKITGGWGGGLAGGFLDKYLRAKEACEVATKAYDKKVKECKRKVAAYKEKKGKCNQYQRLMDSNSCKHAIMVKDTCEAYAGCYHSKKEAFLNFQKKAVAEETDRRAEWRGLKRMECLIKSFADGKVTGAEVDTCKKMTVDTKHLILKHPKIPPLTTCTLPRLYPATGAYKRKEFEPLPTLAKGEASQVCAGMDTIPTTPRAGSPKGTKCSRVALIGDYSAGPLVLCTNGIDTYKSLDKNSCPSGTKLFSPRTRGDWRTFLASAGPVRAPNWIVDVTRPQNGCGGCTGNPMNSKNRNQKTWSTSDGSAWWLRSTSYSEPNGDYTANCYLDLWQGRPANENKVAFNDWRCKYHSKSYYCQLVNVELKPKAGSPKSCKCSKVDLSGKYTAGVLVKCSECLTVYKSTQKNSCPKGMKIFSPASRADWKVFVNSATPLRAPHWIIDVTRPQNSCGGCTRFAMNSKVAQQATWRTKDGSPWWLRSTRYSEPNGDYHANCYLDLWRNPTSADTVTWNDGNCNYRSRSYYCQPTLTNVNYGGHHRRRRAPPAPKPQPPPAPVFKPIDAPVGAVKGFSIMALKDAGWKVWKDVSYGTVTQLKDIQPTKGDCIMWGSKKTAGDTTLALAGFGRRSKIHNAAKVQENGLWWYTVYGKSNGFSKSSEMQLNSADVSNNDPNNRLSWHLHKPNHLIGGYRSGNTKGLNYDGTWRKVVMYGPCKVKAAPACGRFSKKGLTLWDSNYLGTQRRRYKDKATGVYWVVQADGSLRITPDGSKEPAPCAKEACGRHSKKGLTLWDSNYLKTGRRRYKDKLTGTYWVEQADGSLMITPNGKKTPSPCPKANCARWNKTGLTLWDSNYLGTQRRRYKDKKTGTYWVEQADGGLMITPNGSKKPTPCPV